MANKQEEAAPRRRGFSLFSIGGIQIRIDYSWFLIFILIAWSLSAGFFPAQYPGETRGDYWTAGIIATLLFFLSILVHELAHSFVAIRSGIAIPDITLFIFGGVSRLSEDAKNPKMEFKIAVVGPLTSIIIGGVFWLVGAELQAAPPLVKAVITYLAWINVAVGIFNLVPGYPMDGGRILRAIWWRKTGSLFEATRVASDVGKGFAVVLMILGAIEIFTGALIGGLWLIFIGMFLRGVAQAGYQQLVVTRALEGMHVQDVQLEDTATVPPEMPLRQLVDEYFFRYGVDGFPVAKNGEALGVVTLANVKDVPEDRRDQVLVKDVMTRLEEAQVVHPDTTLTDALGRFHGGAQRLLVLDGRDGKQVQGILTLHEIVRRMQVRQALQG